MGVTITETDGTTQESTTRGLVKSVDERKKAPRDGFYMIGNNVFGINAGDYLPAGAEMVPETDAADEPETEERSKGNAPHNKARKTAPENRSA